MGGSQIVYHVQKALIPNNLFHFLEIIYSANNKIEQGNSSSKQFGNDSA